MGNHFCHSCAGCDAAENQAENASTLLSELQMEDAVDKARPSKVQVFTSEGAPEPRKAPPELPRLMLRRPGDTFREQMAMAKVAAVQDMSARTSRSEWSMTGTDCTSPQLAPITPMAMLTEVDSNEGREHEQEEQQSLEVAFDVDGKEVICLISRRPLGAEVCKQPFGPTQVTRVSPRSHAWELGMQPGWVVKKIAGLDVTEKSFEQTHAALAAGLELLPYVCSSTASL